MFANIAKTADYCKNNPTHIVTNQNHNKIRKHQTPTTKTKKTTNNTS